MRASTHFVAAFFALALAAVSTTGCQSYVNSPAGMAMRQKKMESFSHPLIAKAYKAQPTITFPATIGIAPQDAVTQLQLRALDATDKIDSLKKLPQLGGIVNVSSLIIATDTEVPGADGKPVAVWNKSDMVLREAAARLHAQAVLLLKTETTVTDGKIFTPLTLLSLGVFPNDRSEVISTALAALVDTRTGYVYATAERSAGKTCYAMSWDDETRERTVNTTNRKALEKLLGEFPAVWSAVVAKHRGK
jgi:hypothetical protein